MKQQKWTRLAAVTSIVVMLASGCSVLDKKEQSQQIDPPPTGAAEAGAVKTVSAPITNPMQITVFAKDEKGLLAPIALQVEKSESVAKKALEYLVEGGPSQGKLPAGFTSALPKGTKIKDMNIKDKLAIVDFSKEFTDYNLQDERKMLEAVTWTLTSFPTVEKVEFRVEGKRLSEMPVGGTPLDEPTSRAMGINLEKQEGVEYGQATAVTLYFLSQNQEEFKYYVPVTRMVKRTDNVAQTVVEQLIQGPDQAKGLAAVMAPGAELIKVGKENDVITVNFSDKVLGPDKKAPAEAMKSVVLSLTENAGASTKVQILVNGEAKVSSTDNQSYAKPVSRPSTVNQMKL
ncbi:GerMN domain-containing protein [Paenibacillus sp. GD4]|jgi:germination protein M|uniref:GerMN domain-containing protein n=1 Tax=Paenibacillus TaxID=44249 RepID=UPI002543E429|nr:MULTISPECIES: GerMN domain-containing protein [Paenibacillus]MDQ1912352.1 GerMN domain-containing protein [Paenibacillus sp. GD4]